jgi:hypothetical protein
VQHSPAFVHSALVVQVRPPPLAALPTVAVEAFVEEAVTVVAELELVVVAVVDEVAPPVPPVPPVPPAELLVVVVSPPVPLDELAGEVLPPSSSPNSVEPSAHAPKTTALQKRRDTRRRRETRMARYKYRKNVGTWKRLCAIRAYRPACFRCSPTQL